MVVVYGLWFMVYNPHIALAVSLLPAFHLIVYQMEIPLSRDNFKKVKMNRHKPQSSQSVKGKVKEIHRLRRGSAKKTPKPPLAVQGEITVSGTCQFISSENCEQVMNRS